MSYTTARSQPVHQGTTNTSSVTRSRSRSRSRSRGNEDGRAADSNSNSASAAYESGYGGIEEDPASSSSSGDVAAATAFCNSFWGNREEPGLDRGYEALMGRVKNAGKMLEDFRAFFKERAAIEEDYAKRLAKLARMPLGRDETGEMSNVLKRVQYELDSSGRSHNELANVIRQTMEARVKDFEASRDARRRNTQSALERSWKNKLSQEAIVHKAMEKYKSDCILINSFSARLSLTQGKDLDKVTAKLDKAQQTVQVNEGEYKQYCKALKDTHIKWVGEWKAWCDLAQDLEEERIDFVRNALWSYVNAVSLICVKDDESCENVRQVVEACDVARELQLFMHREGPGNIIQDSPHFIDFSDGDKGAAPPAVHPAKFARSSARVEQAPFDGLERLQAAIYPPQAGQANRIATTTPGPTSGNATPASQQASRTQTPHSTGQAIVKQSNADLTPQQSMPTSQPRSASPVKKASTPAEAFESAVNAARTPQAGQSVPPPFPGTANGDSSRSRPPSRAASRAEERKPEPNAQTTAELLQYQASQKRLSAAAFKTASTQDGSTPSSPHYPYSVPSARTAKPFAPPTDTDAGAGPGAGIAASPSAVLPPPPAPVKKEEDPLLAALAKLRSPSSAVDVLPPSSPGVPGNPGLSNVSSNRLSMQVQQQQASSAGSHHPVSRPTSGYGQNATSSAQYGPGQSYRPPSQQYAQARSRPASPNAQAMAAQQQHSYQHQRAPSPQPAAAMMRPPSQPQAGPEVAQAYGQAFLGERRQSVVSPGTLSQAQPQQPVPAHSRPTTPSMQPSSGMAGIGSMASPMHQGRASPALQPAHPGMRSPSPAPVQPPYSVQSNPSQSAAHPGHPQNVQRPPSAYGTAASQVKGQAPIAGRPTTPLGIALDASGSVTQDQMAERYAREQRNPQSQPPHAHPSHYNQHQPPPQTQPMSPDRLNSAYGQSGYQNPQANLPAQHQSAGYKHGAAIYRAASQAGIQHAPQPQQPSQQPMSPASAIANNPAYQHRPASSASSPYQPPLQYGAPASQHQQYPQGYPIQQQGQNIPRPMSQNLHTSQSMGGGMSSGYQGPGIPPSQSQPGQHASSLAHNPSASYRGAGSVHAQQMHQSNSGYMASPSSVYSVNSPAAPQAGVPPVQPHQHHQMQHSASQPLQQQQHHPQQRQASYTVAHQPQQQQQHLQQQQPLLPSQQPLQPPVRNRAPPLKQYTETGLPILFCVKAVYKYDAQTPEEFSFQKDDIICVTETDEDGWWKGELLDPERAKRSGGNVFPSNFVNLLE